MGILLGLPFAGSGMVFDGQFTECVEAPESYHTGFRGVKRCRRKYPAFSPL